MLDAVRCPCRSDPRAAARRSVLLVALALAGCGARSDLDVAGAAAGADAGPSCAAAGAPCATSADCCDAACVEQVCGGPPCHAGDPPVVLSSGLDTPFGLAVDAATVYFTTLANDGAVLAVPKVGGATTAIAPGQVDPESVAVDDGAVYWTSSGGGFVGRVDKSGANLIELASGQSGPSGIALDATHVYWLNYLDPGAVSVIAKEGGAPSVLATGGTGFSRIAVGDAGVTWTDFYTSSVLRVPKQGGAEVIVAQLPGNVGDVALDGDVVYAAAGTSIFRIASPGAPPEPVAPIGGSGAARLAVDGDTLFFTDAQAGDVARVPKAGGAPEILAAGQLAPVGVAVDAWCVYWASAGSGPGNGQILKVPR